MTRSVFASRVVFGAFVIMVAVAMPVAAQTGAAPASTWTAKTGWGHPDLQGIWSNATTTPLQRPDELAGKQVLTDEEVAEREQLFAETRNTDLPVAEGQTGTYNEFWWERGGVLKQTSILVDPPDGRLPPLSPQGQQKAAAYAERQ
jgi:hypothetical protein